MAAHRPTPCNRGQPQAASAAGRAPHERGSRAVGGTPPRTWGLDEHAQRAAGSRPLARQPRKDEWWGGEDPPHAPQRHWRRQQRRCRRRRQRRRRWGRRGGGDGGGGRPISPLGLDSQPAAADAAGSARPVRAAATAVTRHGHSGRRPLTAAAAHGRRRSPRPPCGGGGGPHLGAKVRCPRPPRWAAERAPPGWVGCAAHSPDAAAGEGAGWPPATGAASLERQPQRVVAHTPCRRRGAATPHARARGGGAGSPPRGIREKNPRRHRPRLVAAARRPPVGGAWRRSGGDGPPPAGRRWSAGGSRSRLLRAATTPLARGSASRGGRGGVAGGAGGGGPARRKGGAASAGGRACRRQQWPNGGEEKELAPPRGGRRGARRQPARSGHPAAKRCTWAGAGSGRASGGGTQPGSTATSRASRWAR